jgi:hypothetical protein
MVNECYRRFAGDPYAVAEELQMDLLRQDNDGLLYGIYYLTRPEHVHADYGHAILRRFLNERAVLNPLKNILMQSRDGAFAADMGDILQQTVDRSQRISALNANPVGSVAMPDIGNYVNTPVQYNKTGLPFVDEWINGTRDGDCNGLIGPYQAGKSTLLRQLAIARAEQCVNEAALTGQPPKLVFFFSYEEPIDKFKYSVWACASHIPRSRLEELADYREFSTDDKLEPYEQQYYMNLQQTATGSPTEQTVILGEQSRWELAQSWMNKSLMLCDMSGSNPQLGFGVGSGYVDELVGVIEMNLLERQALCGGVYIDYAGIMVRRYLAAHSVDDDRNRRTKLSSISDQLRQQVAERYNCTVWLAHQVSGEANKKSPTTPLHHADAGESRSLAENMAVCGCLSNKCTETGCTILNWSKVRYAFKPERPPIIQIDGTFSRMIDVRDKYMINSAKKKFVSKKEGEILHGDVEQAKTKSRRQGRIAQTSGLLSEDLA